MPTYVVTGRSLSFDSLSHNMAADSIERMIRENKSKRVRERESVHVSRKTQSLYDLHSDVTWHGCSLFVRYKAVSSAYSQGERMTQGYEYQVVGVLGAIWRIFST